MKHNLPVRMGSLVPGHIRYERGAPVSYEPINSSGVEGRRAPVGPPPWKTPTDQPRYADAPNPPAPRTDPALPPGGERAEWFLAYAIHYHSDYAGDGGEEECDGECLGPREKPHTHYYEQITHFDWAFCEAYPTEKEAEKALERFAKDNGAIDDFAEGHIFGCSEAGGWILQVRPVSIMGAEAVKYWFEQNAWRRKK
jgi:hypothetical protein